MSLPLTSKEKDPGRGSFLIAIMAEDITKAYGRTADGYGRIKFVLPGFYCFIKKPAVVIEKAIDKTIFIVYYVHSALIQ